MIGVTTIPRVGLEFDGAEAPAELAHAITTVHIDQRLDAPTMCEVAFAILSGDADDLELPTPGQELRVAIAGADQVLFEGDVTAVEYVYEPSGGRELHVRGYDRLHRLRKTQHQTVHTNSTVADIAETLASEAGLSVDAELDGPRYHHLIQNRQSDLELLIDLGARCGLHAAVRGDVLHLITLGGAGDEIDLALGVSLLEARFEVNGDPSCRSVSATGWDPSRVEVHHATADTPRVGRDVAAGVDPDDVGGTGELAFTDEAAQDDEHAAALAQAELDVRAAREVSAWGIADGDARLKPGAPISISRVADEVAGRYVLTAATHTVDDRHGYLTEFSTLPPAIARRPRGAVVALGVVTSVDDPEGAGRIRVELPTYDGLETDWMNVVAPGAGGSKGLVMLPDVGDQVLLLLAHEDPSRGVVVGGLYGTGGTPDDAGIEDAAVRRYSLLTPDGHRLSLDDARSSIRLEDSTGSFVELSPEGLVVHALRPLTLEAPGQPIVIRGKSVDFETAEAAE